jgi:hypothetical protein
MLPSAHVEFTWAVANLLARSRSADRWRNLDFRLLAVAAVLPDLIDKPLAILGAHGSHSALLYGHTLLSHLAVWGGVAATRRMRKGLPYLLALSGHLVADRMWGFTRTLLWPLAGRKFHQWKEVGSPHDFLLAYAGVVREEPKLLAFEAVGAVLLAWLIADRRLYRKRSLLRFLRTGRVGVPNDG